LLIQIIEKNELHKYDEGKPELLAARKKVKQKKFKLKKPAKESTDVITLETANRNISLHSNRIKYVIAKEGDNVNSICADLDMSPWQIKKYNDLGGRKNLEEGEVVFLQPKRNKSKSKYHVVEHGETLWDLSQKYGVKMKKLAAYNKLEMSDNLLIGMRLWLKKPPDK